MLSYSRLGVEMDDWSKTSWRPNVNKASVRMNKATVIQIIALSKAPMNPASSGESLPVNWSDDKSDENLREDKCDHDHGRKSYVVLE